MDREVNQLKLSILIPVFNSANIVEKTVSDTMEVLNVMGQPFEILLINDGSRDHSWRVISKLAREQRAVRAFDLLKNYGQHTALFCGIQHARGKYILTMDDDYQTPPSEIPKLIDKIEEGYDVVFARFPQKKHSAFRNWGSRVIQRINEQVFNKPRDITFSNFRIFTREVAQGVATYKTLYPYISGLLTLFASKVSNVDAEHLPRLQGKSNYSLWKLGALAARLLFNYSAFPLRVLSGLGVIVAFFGFALGLFFMLKNLFLGIGVPGWTSLVVTLSFFSGLNLLILGVMGEYLARIVNQLSERPPYVVREKIL